MAVWAQKKRQKQVSTEGVNRLFFQRFCHQPFDPPRYPGMTFGQYGWHFDRTQTWWKEAKEYVRYVTRCQYLLQNDGMNEDRFFVCAANRAETSVERAFPVVGRTPEIWYPETGKAFRARHWREKGGKTFVSVRLPTAGSAFVVFRSECDVDIPLEPALAEILAVPVEGTWSVSFVSPVGNEPKTIDLMTLTDWAQSSDPLLRGFSGTATYRHRLPVPARITGTRLVLDLGEVCNFATVTVNGKEYPPLWKPPFSVDVTDAAAGGNSEIDVAVRITNLWPNRLIADDALPESERRTWTSWRHWKSTDAPMRSGLLGPVKLRILKEAEG